MIFTSPVQDSYSIARASIAINAVNTVCRSAATPQRRLQGHWVQMTRLTGRIHVAAYKAMCLTHHPDRHTSSPEPLREAAQERFKQLQDALSILGGCALTGEAGLYQGEGRRREAWSRQPCCSAPFAQRATDSCTRALNVAEDPLKRQLYDEGHCKEAIEERAAAASRAAHSAPRPHR